MAKTKRKKIVRGIQPVVGRIRINFEWVRFEKPSPRGEVSEEANAPASFSGSVDLPVRKDLSKSLTRENIVTTLSEIARAVQAGADPFDLDLGGKPEPDKTTNGRAKVVN